MCKSILGIHTAIIGGVFPLTAKVADTVWNKMYEKLSANPTPKMQSHSSFHFSG